MPPKTPNMKPRTSPAPGPPKMRSSCKACADSKIGCTKERPTCSRCERRDVPCVYVATKRAGRPAKNKPREQSPSTKANSGPTLETTTVPSSVSPSSISPGTVWPSNMANTTMTDTTMNDPTLTDATTTDTTMSETAMSDTTGMFTPPSSMAGHTLDWCFPAYSGLLESMSASMVDKDDLVSSLPSLTQPLSQLLGASPPLSLLDDNRTFDWDSFLFQSAISNEANGFQNYEKMTTFTQDAGSDGLDNGDRNGETPFSLGSRRVEKPPADSIDWFAITDAPHTAGDALMSQVSATKDCSLPSSPLSHDKHPSRGCLARCLSLLDNLTPQWTAVPCTQTDEKTSAPTTASFESVIAQNQAAIDAVDEILKCPCSRNSVLLFTIALVVFKTLGWYAACANAAPRTTNGHNSDTPDSMVPPGSPGRKSSMVRRPLQSTMLDYEMDIDYEDRIVCQIVLSKLYSVRRTLNVLAQRLTETEEKPDTPISSTDRVAAATEDLLLDGPAFNSSNPSSLGQSLATSLRCHLHELCEHIVRTLSAI